MVVPICKRNWTLTSGEMTKGHSDFSAFLTTNNPRHPECSSLKGIIIWVWFKIQDLGARNLKYNHPILGIPIFDPYPYHICRSSMGISPGKVGVEWVTFGMISTNLCRMATEHHAFVCICRQISHSECLCCAWLLEDQRISGYVARCSKSFSSTSATLRLVNREDLKPHGSGQEIPYVNQT